MPPVLAEFDRCLGAMRAAMPCSSAEQQAMCEHQRHKYARECRNSRAIMRRYGPYIVFMQQYRDSLAELQAIPPTSTHMLVRMRACLRA